MSADVLFDPSFPHGTPGGFRLGCRGSKCPAFIPCRDVHRRYVGDFRFARRFDQGLTLAEIVELDWQDEREDRKATRAAKPRREPSDVMIPRARLVKMVTVLKMTDREMATELGLTREQVMKARARAGLPVNRAPRRGLLATHCKHGHEYTAENTHIRADNSRICKECGRASQRRRTERRRAAAQQAKGAA